MGLQPMQPAARTVVLKPGCVKGLQGGRE